MSGAHRTLCLAVALSDNTFEQVVSNGKTLWQGKCIHCRSHLLVGSQGELVGHTTLEHILPQSHGGDDALENLALACRRCNNLKGKRLDNLRPGDMRLMRVVEKLLAERQKRTRT